MVLLAQESSTSDDKAGAARSGRWCVAILLLLAGLLVFAHGCHGDEDNELLAQGVAALR
jgi:hypothetical protein